MTRFSEKPAPTDYRLQRDMFTSQEFHHLIKRGNLQRVRELLKCAEIDINAYDRRGYTPLMHAVKSPKANVELVRLLLEHGASVHSERRPNDDTHDNVVSLALAGGDPQKVVALLENGADIHYKRIGGYDALIDAVTGHDALRNARLIDLLNLLIANGVALSAVSAYRESGLRVLSRIGRFDAIQLLLDAGADASHLEWTPLIRAVALGSLAAVEEVVECGASLEEKDWWERTAWLIAVQTGDISKAHLLLEHGAKAGARGRCGKPSLFYAIENYHSPMLRWLLELGAPIEETNDFGATPLIIAAECGNAEGVDVLLNSGTDLNAEEDAQTALAFVRTRESAIRLLEAGADPGQLPFEARRALLGLEPDADEDLLDVSPAGFRNGRSRRFGTQNPEEIFDPFWKGMIRAGINAYQAAQLFEGQTDEINSPVWCAQRFGQSITLLPDGRIVQIGGEHEDSYDQDFCIYNDVFVHEPDGTIHIFGYPESIFPPTDFHTATLAGEHIYIIGSLGYQGTREYGQTPVFRLNTRTFRIEPVNARGEVPGWIYQHRATQPAVHEIRILGGTIATWNGSREMLTKNERSFIFDTKRSIWRPD
jgi:ankyrin repeat protein